MDAATIAAITGIITTIITCGIAIANFWTIKEMKKGRYATERPYLSCYFVYDENHKDSYLFIGNFGNSSAIIKKFHIEPKLLLLGDKNFNDIKGTLVAPKQKIHFALSKIFMQNKFQSNNEDVLSHNIEIEYSDINFPEESFKEKYTANINYIREIAQSRIIEGKDNVRNILRNIERAMKTISTNSH